MAVVMLGGLMSVGLVLWRICLAERTLFATVAGGDLSDQ